MPQVGQVLNGSLAEYDCPKGSAQGNRVWRYQLKEKLGQDASRQTWLAIDLASRTQEQVIVKLLALNPEIHLHECKLFEREAQVLQQLNHLQIPKYQNYFIIDHQPGSRFSWFGLVHSYIPGVSLQQLLDEGKRFSEVEVEKIAVEVLNILIYLHEQNPPVIHRDIKPSNLIWGEDGRVYLVDFGAVQDQAVLEGATFTVVGTYGYVPMEQFGGRAVPASDLYALGATLIHLLTGVVPAELPQHDARIQFADRVTLDRGLVNWIGKLTEPSLSERLNTARQALEALKHKHTLSPPNTSHKPTGSQIQLKKSASQLEIRIPRRGRKAFRAFYLLGFIVPFVFHLPNYFNIVAIAHTSTFWFFALYTLAIASIGVSILNAVILPAFEHTYLYFDSNSFEIKRKLFGIPYWWRRGKTSKIMKIYEEDTKRTAAPKGVTIDTGNQKYTTNPLATVERLWLIQELKDWLRLR
ncbi:MAG: serine/threonine-protein kinase [Coleofasciculaceae cyanobacterium]